MRNRPHGLTRVSAKSAAKGKFEAEERIWPGPCLGPNLFVLQVIRHGKSYSFRPRGVYVSCDDA